MEWTKEKPTKAGYYWFYQYDEKAIISPSVTIRNPAIVEVFWYKDILGVSEMGDIDGNGWTLEAYQAGYWMGPLEEPENPSFDEEGR